MLSSTVGIIHFIASVLALITGTMVLSNTKGTKRHRQIGYGYTLAMAVVLVTAFMIYRLHGSFGVLHVFAVISSLTLLAGIIPMWLRKPAKYLALHFSFMYWSVIGLYCAFCAEVLTRLPFLLDLNQDIAVVFYTLVGVATAVVGGIGSLYFKKYQERWSLFTQHSDAY